MLDAPEIKEPVQTKYTALNSKYHLENAAASANVAYWVKDEDRPYHLGEMIGSLKKAAKILGYDLVPSKAQEPSDG